MPVQWFQPSPDPPVHRIATLAGTFANIPSSLNFLILSGFNRIGGINRRSTGLRRLSSDFVNFQIIDVMTLTRRNIRPHSRGEPAGEQIKSILGVPFWRGPNFNLKMAYSLRGLKTGGRRHGNQRPYRVIELKWFIGRGDKNASKAGVYYPRAHGSRFRCLRIHRAAIKRFNHGFDTRQE